MSLVTTPETIEPLALSPDDAAAYLSLSRWALSDLIAEGAVDCPQARSAHAGRSGKLAGLLRGTS